MLAHGSGNLLLTLPGAKLHKFAVIVVAGDGDPGWPRGDRLQHELMQLSTLGLMVARRGTSFVGKEGIYIGIDRIISVHYN